MELLNNQESVPAPNNHDITVLMYFIFMELVDRDVIGKQKELLADIVRGVLGAKIEYLAMAPYEQV